MSFLLKPESIDWKPIYSICICNYNMSKTLYQSISSIAKQINENFEIVIVDDGSCDNSVDLLRQLQLEFNFIRLIFLARDSRRKLGETRNISIRAARGKYCFLHIDADDIWQDFFLSFAQIYHEIESRLGISDFMLSGRQIQLASKNVLLEYPYMNLYFGEDRTLWSQLAVAGKLIVINHKEMRVRIPIQSTRKKIFKVITSQCSGMTTTFSLHPNPIFVLRKYLYSILIGSPSQPLSGMARLVRLACLPWAMIYGCFLHRSPLINQHLPNYLEQNLIDLKKLEDLSLSKFGPYKLNAEERTFYNLD